MAQALPADQPSGVDGESGTPAEASTVDWAELPEPVRTRLAELASAALGGLATVDIPANLRAVARFAPQKRAQVGGGAILATLRDSAAFRSAAVQWLRDNRASTVDLAQADPVAVAAAAVLLGDNSAAHYVELVGRRRTDANLRAERDAALAKAQRLADELAKVRAELSRANEAAEQARAADREQLERLQRKLREKGVHAREARDAAAEAAETVARVQAEAAAQIAELTGQRDRERQRAESERTRAARAEAEATFARQSAKEARQADEVRLALLVDTMDGVVSGLRRELALGGAGPRPADLVRSATTAQGATARADDPAALDRLLALPSVHLIVDGYNVTKTGWPELSLADQRDRLTRALAALAARTSAEVTLVFDGAGVVASASAPRGVRVLFSDPGVLADDVITELVSAEPQGRPVIVVTSDRAVVKAVHRRGAHSVPSNVLIDRLSRN